MGLMSLFRREPASGETPKAKQRGSRSAKAVDHEATVQRLRQQARRRLLGAAVLVGVGIVAFPIVFETQPRPVPMDLPIVIPAKDRTETPRVVAAAELPAQLPEAAELQGSEAAPLADPAPPPLVASETPPRPTVTERQPTAAPRAVAQKPADRSAERSAERPATPKPADANSPRYVVQVGAFADRNAAQAARARLEAKGLKTYAQIAKTKEGDRIRVRLGPFADRADAEKAAAQARAAGLAGAVLTL